MLVKSALLLLVALVATPKPVADYTDTGPLNLLITYRCEAPRRPAFREYMQGEGLARLEAWKQEGVLKSYRVFFNWYVDEGTWDATAMLQFAEYADVGKWNKIERTMPGGLTKEALELAVPTTTSSADIVWRTPGKEPDVEHPESVYILIPYTYQVLVAEYKEYVDGYVIPQLDGWLEAGTLRSYEVLLNRYPTGDRWGSMLLLEYKDLESFGRRKFTKNQVRAALREDPAWMAWSEIKRTIRTELEPVITDRLLRGK